MYNSVNTVMEFHREAGEICLYLVRQFEAELAKTGHIFTK